jgi:hypothetical protein
VKDPKSHGLGEQYASYRRGLVLGLTMAEVGILIIFVLLLLIVFNQWLQEEQERAFHGKEAVPTERLHELEAAASVTEAMRATLQLPPTASVEEISRLVRALQEQVHAKPEARTVLQETREALAQMRKTLDDARKEGVPEALAKQLEKQSFQIKNQEGQLQRYESQLKEAGLGKGERPCWVKPDGTIEFLYDVVLTSTGIRMREYEYPQRSKERATLPMPVVQPEEVLTEDEFLRRTQPLYNSSLALNCRFFVVIYDGTEPAEKELYKHELRTVEGHFYKRLDRGPAPF